MVIPLVPQTVRPSPSRLLAEKALFSGPPDDRYVFAPERRPNKLLRLQQFARSPIKLITEPYIRLHKLNLRE